MKKAARTKARRREGSMKMNDLQNESTDERLSETSRLRLRLMDADEAVDAAEAAYREAMAKRLALHQLVVAVERKGKVAR